MKKILLGENDENAKNFVEGPSMTGQDPELTPARDAAARMEKLIHDQIEESNGATELRSALFEASLLGTGIIKGPFTYDKTLHRWEVDPKTKKRIYKPTTVKVPRVEFCSVFDAFPDPNARNMEEAEWFIQRHKLSRSQVRALKNRPYFDTTKINKVLDSPPDYVNKDYENELMAENNQVYPANDRYEVLEYWGILDRKALEEMGMDLSGEYPSLKRCKSMHGWLVASLSAL